MTQENINPCPVCGGKAKVNGIEGSGSFTPHCTNKKCGFVVAHFFESKEAAIKGWNTLRGIKSQEANDGR